MSATPMSSQGTRSRQRQGLIATPAQGKTTSGGEHYRQAPVFHSERPQEITSTPEWAWILSHNQWKENQRSSHQILQIHILGGDNKFTN
jgi:hypothetical protein